MKLFIANCTKQEYQLASRIPEMTGVKIVILPIGGQMQIAGELNQPQITAIIDQHLVYGLASVAQFDKMKEFVPLVYSEGKPVSADVIRRVMSLNNGILVQRGKDMRQQAAVAVSEAISEVSPNLETLEMSVTEEKRGDFTDTPIAEGVRVTASDEVAPPRNRGGRPRKNA